MARMLIDQEWETGFLSFDLIWLSKRDVIVLPTTSCTTIVIYYYDVCRRPT